MGAASPLVLALLGTTAPEPAAAQAVNLGGATANNIRADGRTKTRITVDGARTKIETDTVSNGVGFNSFSDFQQAAGTQVDLFLPDNTGSLVNIVRNGTVVVDGVLNAYKNGKIGGNVFFSSPDGFVVGKTGQINVGSLTVNTPTQDFLDRVIDANGRIDDALAHQLMTGEIPISRNGHIAIAGEINAEGGITLMGHSVRLSTETGPLTFDDLGQRTRFEATVNSTGLVEGGRLVSRGGRIVVEAVDAAAINGRIAADGANADGGSIEIRAQDILLGQDAFLSADGTALNSLGGDIFVLADGSLTVESGGRYSAVGTGAGDGGFLEFSGAFANIGAVTTTLGSDTGADGLFLIDPFDLVVGGVSVSSGPGDDLSFTTSIISDGADVRLEADNSIRVTGTGVIDTRDLDGGGASEGDSGDITLVAPEIILDPGAQLLAGVTVGSVFAAGDVTLTAERSGGTARIVVGDVTGAATVTGGSIDLSAASVIDSGGFLPAFPDATATVDIANGTISAVGALSASATASVTSSTGGALPIGVIEMDVAARVSVGGASVITAASLDLQANATATSVVATSSALNPASNTADGAVAISDVSSRAVATIGGQADIDTTGATSLGAVNTVKSSASATPDQAAFGASLGVSIVEAETVAEIMDDADVDAGSLDLSATTSTDVTVTAAAAAGGADAPEDGSETKEYLDDPKYGGQASTSGGSVSVVGALAISDITSVTQATVSTSQTTTVTGAATLTATSDNQAAVTADGSAVDSATGVGVAVGLNLADITTDVAISDALTAGSMTLSAQNAADGQKFTTVATSGAGASGVGVAGSFALNLIDTEFSATLGAGSAISISGAGAVALTSDNATEVTSEAKPSDAGVSGDKVGVGGSVAMNIVGNRSTASIADGASITGASDVAASASGTFTASAEAQAGATGGVSLTPALGLSIIANTTSARLGSGATLLVSGSATLSALQEATTTTKASGEAAGAKAAVGAAVAVALVDDVASAHAARGIDAGASVKLTAAGSSTSDLEATASAVGAAPSEDDGSSSSGKDVDALANDELSSGATKQKNAGVGSAEQQSKTEAGSDDADGRSAETSEGKLSVAAAVGVNVQDATVVASVADGQSIDAGADLVLSADANTTGQVTSTGDAVGKEDSDGETPPASAVGIGAAVSVNKVKAANTASLGNAAHTAGGLDLRATSRDVAALRSDPATTDTKSDTYLAKSTAGAGASNVGLAGAFGLNLVDTESAARVSSGASVSLTGAGSVSIVSDNQTESTAEAKPTGGGASGDTVGIGASVAINILANRSTAEIVDGAVLTGAGAVKLMADGTHSQTADAAAGSAGGVSITPVLGLSLIGNATTARIGTGAALVAGSIEIAAAQSSATITKASGEAAGANAAIGAAVAIALVDDAASATTARDLTTMGDVSLSAYGASASELEAEASAVGAAAAEDDGSAPSGDDDVDAKVSGELDAGSSKQKTSGVGDSTQQSKTTASAADEDSRSASTSEGKVSVAAAVGVNVQDAQTEAGVPDGVQINSGGSLTIKTAANTQGKVTTTGDAVGKEDADGNTPPASAVGIGAAVSVNLVKSSNQARLGVAAHSVGALEISALSRDVDALRADGTSTADKTDSYLASATSGAGGSKVGIAGSLGLNLIDTEALAIIASGANVDVTGGGNVSLMADNQTDTKAEAKPVGAGATGETVGIGASVAINILANRSVAEIEDTAVITGANDLTLAASATHSQTADAAAGSAGGVSITPALGLSIIGNDTTARLGTGALQTITGTLDVSATQSSTTVTNASGEAAGSKAAIGAAVAVALVDDTATATTARSLSIGGSASFAAQSASSSSLETKASAVGAAEAEDDGEAQAGETDVNSNVDGQLDKGTERQATSGVGSADQRNRSKAGSDDKASRSAETSEGKVNVAAAVGVNVQTNEATAAVPDGVAISATGALSITATADTDASNATTGDAVGEPDADGNTPPAAQVGIGAAVSVNVVRERNSATLGNAVHVADGVNIAARQAEAPTDTDVDTISASASSGAGGSKVGIAGSVALNNLTIENTARIAAGATVDAGTGASTIMADERLAVTATAAPVDAGVTGGKVGIGASVALNFVDVTTTAEVADAATVNNGAGLTVTANSKAETETVAKAGAAGGIAVDASLALARLDVRTTARIGSGAGLNMTGSVGVSATSSGANVAMSEGENKGGRVAVGASAAVIFGDGANDGALKNSSVTIAEVARDITATGLAVNAASDRSYKADASATASGGFFSDSDETKNDTTGGTATSSNSLKQSQGSQRGTQNGSKVTVAAAAGIASAQDRTEARLGSVTVDVSGPLAVTSNNTVGMATSGSGAALDPQTNVGVGIGVGLGIIKTTTIAEIADGATVTQSGDLTVTATSKENTEGDFADLLTAQAVSGASAAKVSVAGALAVAISDGSTRASIGDGVNVSNAGAVKVGVDNTSQLSSKALAGSLSRKAGIGASVAVVVSEKDYSATVGAGVNIVGTSLSVTAKNNKVSGPAFSLTPTDTIVERLRNGTLLGASNYYTEALGGSAGNSVAVQGSFAVMVFDDDLTASVGQSLDGTTTTQTTVDAGGGSVEVRAEGDMTAKALSGAISASGSNAIGVASSVIDSTGSTTSRVAPNARINNAGSFNGVASAKQDIQTFGVAVAGGISNGVSGVATVLLSENSVEALVGRNARIAINGAGAATLSALNTIDNFNLATGVGVGGSNGIGASGAVTTVRNTTRAEMADGSGVADRAAITTGGAVNISATARAEADTIAVAGGAGGTVGAGAGVGTYVFNTRTTARVGAFGQVGNSAASGSATVEATDDTTLSAGSGAAGGGGTAGVGAAVAVGVLTKNTTAEIADSANVDAFDVKVAATSSETIVGAAAGLGVGGTAGLAGSVAVNRVDTTTLARVGAGASILAGGSVGVIADGVTRIDMIDAAVAGGAAGVGASVGVSIVTTNTQAVIADNASVTALGGGAGLLYTTGLDPQFSSYLAGDDFGSADVSPGSGDDSPVKISGSAENNDLRTADDARATGIALLTKKRSVQRQTATGTGLIVNATGQTATRSLSVGGAFGGVGVALSASVPIVTTTTKATIGANAQINQGPGTATSGQNVSVAAISDHYTLGFGGAIAGGGSAAGAGVSVGVLSATAEASTGAGAQISAARDLSVRAVSQQDFSTMAAAGAISAGLSLAGGASATSVTTRTTAELGGTVVVQGNADVIAEDTTRNTLLAGSVAVGGTAGAGAAVGVLNLNKTVKASVAANADVTALGLFGSRTVFGDVDGDGTGSGGTDIGYMTTRSSRGLNVLANSAQSTYTLAVSGAGGLWAGLSGVVSLNLFDVTTQAYIGQNAQINTMAGNAGANAQQDVIVTARDTTVSDVAAGSIAVGAVGLAGTLDAGIFKANTSAFIEDGVTVNARGDVAVTGVANKAGDSFVVSGSIGLGALAAGVAVYSYGDGVASGGAVDSELGDSSDQDGRQASFGGLVADAQSQIDDGTVDDELLSESDDDNVKQISADAQAVREGVDLASAASALTIPGGTSASIGQATINAGGGVGVASTETLDLEVETGAIAGGAVGVGAGVAVVTVDTGSTAQITGAAAVTSNTVGVAALTGHSLDVVSRAAAGGIFAGVSADVAIVTDRSRTLAAVTGAALRVAGATRIGARSTRLATAEGLGISVAGTVAVGASVAKATIGGSVAARLNGGASVGTSGDEAGDVEVSAEASDQVATDALAVGGGVGFALQGALGDGKVETDVDATVSAASINSTGAVDVSATSLSKADSEAEGVAVAGLGAAGASSTDAEVATTADATVNANALIDAGSISIAAQSGNAGSGDQVRADSMASAGALVGLNATEASATNTASTNASASNSSLRATSGSVAVTADGSSQQRAQASGLAVGLVAAGANFATASAGTTKSATLTDMVGVTAGTLTVEATGNDLNAAEAVAGSGGLVAGSAAEASTVYNGQTRAGILASSPGAAFTVNVTGAATIEANQTTEFAGYVDSRQASLAGSSGAALSHRVTSNVSADVGDDITLLAEDLAIRALNSTVNEWRGASGVSGDAAGWNVDSVSGGLASVPAGGSTVTVNHTTTARIGDRAMVTLRAPSLASRLSDLNLEAGNKIEVRQKVKLDSGGAIAIALADVQGGFTANAAADIGDSAKVVVQRGDIAAAAFGTADIDMRANATTYGLAGAPSANADVLYVGNNTVSVGQNALVEASDGINRTDGSEPSGATILLAAGKKLDGSTPVLAFNATADAYNKTAIPIPTAPNPTVTVRNFGTLSIESTADSVTGAQGVRAAGNITLAASQGDISARAKGFGKDIYREALAKAASAISNAFGGGDVSFDYHGGSTNTRGGLARVVVDGLVETGIQREKSIQFNYVTGNCNAQLSACVADFSASNIDATISGPEPVGTNIVERIRELEQLRSDYDADAVARAAYTTEIRFLQNKLVDLGLGSFNSSGEFVDSAFTGASPREALLAEAASASADISTIELRLGSAGTVGIDTPLSVAALEVQQAYNDATAGLSGFTATALTTIQSLSGYDGTVTAQANLVSTVNTALSEGTDAANAVKAAEANTIQRRANIEAQIDLIEAAQNDLETARVNGNSAGETSALTAIANAKSAIEGELAGITSNNSTIQTQSATAQSRATTIRTSLNSLLGIIPDSTDSDTKSADDTKRASLTAAADASGLGGALTNIGIAETTLTDAKVSLDTETATIGSRVGTFNAATVTPGTVDSVDNSLTQFIDLLDDRTGTFATKTIEAQSASSDRTRPSTFTIEVADTQARLGNISVDSDLLTGSGALKAPGDASILVENNTSNTLKLGNLIIPTYDAGNVRFRGGLVYSNDDINVLNNSYLATRGSLPTGVTGTATFSNSNIVTQLTTSRGNVTVVSNYNADSNVFYDPALPPDVNVLRANRRVPPDIILQSGRIIENTRGAVNIESAQGNIYINGQINAGSVNILAKNGDFVSSFVNGFNHIGGDPASFSNPTNAAERGAGITANGAISISARFLNINSRIQSGIADWNVTLNSSDKLTVDWRELGISQSAFNTAVAANASTITVSLGGGNTMQVGLNTNPAAIDTDQLADLIQQYQDEVVRNPDADPIRTVLAGGQPIQINLKDYLSGTPGARVELTTAQAQAYTAAQGGEGIYSVLASGNIGASYDATNDSYIVNGTSVRGGYIEVFGQIINTSSSGGELRALDGFGQIDVINNTGKTVQIRNMSTGEDPTGTLRGIAGKIRLTDVIRVDASNAVDPLVRVMVTEYTYNPGADQVEVNRQTGRIDNATGNIIELVNVAVGPTAGRETSYTPGESPLGTIYPRYLFTELEKFFSEGQSTVTRSQFFGSDALTISEARSFRNLTGEVTESVGRVDDGTYLTIDTTPQSGASELLSNGIYVNGTATTRTNASLNGQALVTSEAVYLRQAPEVERIGTQRNCNWWTLCALSDVTDTYRVTQRFNRITTNSLKANYPIKVEFIGSQTGGIGITSNADVVLNSPLRNAAGTTRITTTAGGNIVQGTRAAEVEGVNVIYNAAGSVGGVTSAVAPAGPVASDAQIVTTLTRAEEAVPVGSLRAVSASGGVAVRTTGNMIVDLVQADTGAVNLIAQGGITGLSAASKIQGERVKLQAVAGSIGSVTPGSELTVNTAFTPGASFREFGDPVINPALRQDPAFGLTATASDDIGIKSTVWSGNASGSILVENVETFGGDVRLVTPGRVLDNQPVEQIDARTYDQLLSFWDTLGLLEGSAENIDKQNVQITAFENAQTQSYRQYWRIRQSQPDGGAAYDPTFQVVVEPGSAQFEVLSAQFRQQAQNEGTPAGDLDAAVATKLADFEAQQTAEYHSLHDTVGGFTGAFDSGFSYAATTAERDDLTRKASWTERELAFTLAPGALKTVTGTNPIIKDPNITGRTITLVAGDGVGETINQGAGLSIISSTEPRDLTIDQKVALAAAERNDLELQLGRIDDPGAGGTQEQRDAYAAALAQGVTNPVGVTTIPLGVEFDDLTPAQQAALDAAALGLVAADQTTLAVLVKRPLNFETAGALNLDVATAEVGPSSDAGRSYLASRQDANLGVLTTLGETRVKVRGDIRNASSSLIQTGDIILEAAQGAIGSPAVPVRLTLLADATTVARAQNGVYLDFAGDGIIDTVYSPGDISLIADNSLKNANSDDLINILGTEVALEARNGSVGEIGRPLNVGVNLGGSITADATGAVSLFGTATNPMIIGRIDAGGTVAIGLGGSATIDGPVRTPGSINIAGGGRLVATDMAQILATTGDITIQAGSLKLLNGSQTTATLGKIDIETDDDVVVTGLTAGSADADAVRVVAGGTIFGGTSPVDRTDITAASAGAGVILQAGVGIGDATQANDRAVDGPGDVPGSANAVTDVANPIRFLASQASASAGTGGVVLTALADTTVSSINAPGGPVVVDGLGALTFTDVQSGGSQDLSATTTLDFAQLTSTGLPGDPGDITVSAGQDVTGGVIDAAGQVSVFGVNVIVSTVTSAGSQTLSGTGNVGFTQLTATGSPGDPGDVDVVAGQDVNGGAIDAAGKANVSGVNINMSTVTSGGSQTLAGTGSVMFTDLTSTGRPGDPGDIDVMAGQDVTGDTITSAGKVGVSGDNIVLATVTSQGSQTVDGTGDVQIDTAIALGKPGDPGDVDVSAGGALQTRTINAAGSIAASGATVTFEDLTAGQNVRVTSPGAVTGGNILAGVDSFVMGDTVTFNRIEAGNDNEIISGGDINGNVQIAGNKITNKAGSATRRGSIDIGNMSARLFDIEASGDFKFDQIDVAERLDLRADVIEGNVRQVPPGPNPLRMTITGGFGQVATRANLFVDAPAGLTVERVSVVDTDLRTTATTALVQNAFIPGEFILRTPLQTIDVNNRSPQPRGIGDVQLFALDRTLSFGAIELATISDETVIGFNALPDSTFEPNLDQFFFGVSLTRDSIRFLRTVEGQIPPYGGVTVPDPSDDQILQELADELAVVVIDGVEYQIFFNGRGPAVLLEQGT